MREEITVNLLKQVVTRIDYEDQFEIEAEKLREIKNLCEGQGIKEYSVYNLKKGDFSLNDNNVLREIPEEYLRKCQTMYFYSDIVWVEINQFFIRIARKTNRDNYKRYTEHQLPIVLDVLNILDIPKEHYRRVAIKKVDEIYYEDLEKMEMMFKPEIVQRNIFGDKQNWDVPNVGSSVTQNFVYENHRVNFVRNIDRGKKRYEDTNGIMKDIILYRLCLDYEVYEKNLDLNEIDRVLLEELNDVTENLFVKTFTEKGENQIFGEGELMNYEFGR